MPVIRLARPFTVAVSRHLSNPRERHFPVTVTTSYQLLTDKASRKGMTCSTVGLGPPQSAL